MRHLRQDAPACLLLLLLSLPLAAHNANDILDAPQGNPTEVRVPETDGPPVMVDGRFSPGEWDDAVAIDAGQGISLHLKQEKGQVYVGVRCAALGTPVVDLFLQPAGREIHQLHASAQIGEIVLAGPGEEDPAFVWGYSPEWTANEVRWDQARRERLMAGGMDGGAAQVETIFPYDGFEFQIRRSRFASARWLLRVEVHSAQGHPHFPQETERKDVAGWLPIDLGVGTGG